MLRRALVWVRHNTRRAVAVVLAPALPVLAFDAGVAHLAGTGSDSVLQRLPVAYGVLGFVALWGVSAVRRRAAFAWGTRLVGALGVALGLTGSAFHLLALGRELEGEISLLSLEGALSVAPPLFAPLAFAGVGALLLALPSRRLLLRVRLGVQAAPGTHGGAPQPSP